MKIFLTVAVDVVSDDGTPRDVEAVKEAVRAGLDASILAAVVENDGRLSDDCEDLGLLLLYDYTIVKEVDMIDTWS